MSEKDKALPDDWLYFLETRRRKAQDEKLENTPWVCVCGRPVGNGSPHDAVTRTGNSLWLHILSKIVTESHPCQSDVDRLEAQIPHSEKNAPRILKKTKFKWGSLDNVWPYIANLNQESLRDLKSQTDVFITDKSRNEQ